MCLYIKISFYSLNSYLARRNPGKREKKEAEADLVEGRSQPLILLLLDRTHLRYHHHLRSLEVKERKSERLNHVVRGAHQAQILRTAQDLSGVRKQNLLNQIRERKQHISASAPGNDRRIVDHVDMSEITLIAEGRDENRLQGRGRDHHIRC